MCVAKTKALVSCAVTAQLICAFIFAWEKVWLSHEVAHLFLMYHLVPASFHRTLERALQKSLKVLECSLIRRKILPHDCFKRNC